MAITNSKIYKVAGLSLVGFCAVSLGVDRANVGPVVSQLAGFGGAFLGALVAQRRLRSVRRTAPKAPEKVESAGNELFSNRAVEAETGKRQEAESPEFESEPTE